MQLRIYRGGSWRPLDAEEERICVASRSSSGPPLQTHGLPPISPKLADELRALGYVD